jgi:hypothetical protein
VRRKYFLRSEGALALERMLSFEGAQLVDFLLELLPLPLPQWK